LSGQWACTGRSEPVPGRSDSFEPASTSHLGLGRASSSVSSSHVPPSDASTSRVEVNSVSSLPTRLARPSNPLAGSSHAFSHSLHTSHQGSHLHTSVSNSTGLPDPNTFPFPSPASAIPPPAPSSAFPAFPLQGLYDWTTNPYLSNPSSLLTQCPDGSLAIDATAFGWNGQLEPSTTDLWDDFDHILSTAGQDSTPAGHSHAHTANQSRVLFLNNERPMRQGVSLAEICEWIGHSENKIKLMADARVVESWLVGLPPRVRDFARARIMALNDNKGLHTSAVIIARGCANSRRDARRSIRRSNCIHLSLCLRPSRSHTRHFRTATQTRRAGI
jgi:hypothetical protein